MSIFIRRKKLFEDGEQQNAAQQPANNTQAPAQPQQNTTPVPDANAQQQTPANNTQPQTQPANNQQQAPQQAQEQPQQDPKAAELNKKVNDCVVTVKGVIEKNDPYTLIAYDLPGVMQQMVPEFTKENPNAKATMDAWGKFKQAPSKDSFDAFINEFTSFGNGGQKADANAQQTQPQPAATPEANNATAQQAQQESMYTAFGQKLNERLNHSKFMHKNKTILEKNWTAPKLVF